MELSSRLWKTFQCRAPFRAALIICFLASFVLRASSAQEKRDSGSLPPQSVQGQAAQKTVSAPVDPETYIIGPEDVLSVQVWAEPQLSGPVVVRPDGKITLPLLGDVAAGGETPQKLAETITVGISKYVTKPLVTVAVATVNSKKYFIVGEVQRPGSYPLVVPTTVTEALAIAGGFRDYAKKKDIQIIRGPKRIRFNYEDFVRGKSTLPDIRLQNGDHVVVP